MGQLADDFFDDEREIEDMISEAEANASNAWEDNFVEGLRDKFDQYGIRMYLSDKQHEILERIASGENRPSR